MEHCEAICGTLQQCDGGGQLLVVHDNRVCKHAPCRLAVSLQRPLAVQLVYSLVMWDRLRQNSHGKKSHVSRWLGSLKIIFSTLCQQMVSNSHLHSK